MTTATTLGTVAIERLTAADVMTPDPITITDRDTVAAAWELLARGAFHHLPVVHAGRCIGMLDDRTLLQAWQPGMLSRVRRQVVDLLPRRPATVRPDLPLVEVAGVLRRQGVDAVAVMDAHERLVGVVTSADIVAAVAGAVV